MPPRDSPCLVTESAPSMRCAIFSAILPGLGQFVRGHPKYMVWVHLTGVFLAIVTWGLSTTGGIAAGIFFAMLIILPWWCLQAYAAYLPAPLGQLLALQSAWKKAHDIRYLGGLFLLTALTDFYIILVNPEYGFTVFCSKPSGFLGTLAKAQSPILHLLIGYGFIQLRRWSFFVYMAYAGFGLVNATLNYACFGFGRIRTVFLISLLFFTIYVALRRQCFKK